MNHSSSSSSSAGIGVTGMLGVLFVALKLTGHIDWSWWWVTAPFWIPAVILFFIILAVAVHEVRQSNRLYK